MDASGFTARFSELYDGLRAPEAIPADLPAAERTRRERVALELSQGQPTLAEADFQTLGDEDRAILRHVSKAAELVERIYARQKGDAGLEAKIPADDAASQALFYRNQEPLLRRRPKTEKDADCNALSRAPARVVGPLPGGAPGGSQVLRGAGEAAQRRRS